ncbi:Asr1405/Asl0597 family protein [Gloeocapsa sp. PCC 73106]|uniref:Asr1405/Asl0597 family protein n=1 Tax=Gloeocapsa sp. PCC 73106 TaxID=102232 RepID=UPI0002AB9A88|nr:Asr1405/Asl0597 family protein [Gloeocapsa sp. PCC 73106]ELR98263.1 hypothetical protein GLO73106DRAFT_00020900 [Gloeocapsa sp. PCC 73106]
MKVSPSPDDDYQTIEIKLSERWQVYYRLQELGVTCACQSNQPLQIKMTSPLGVLQVWNVVRQQTTPRTQLIEWLETCWRTNLPVDSNLKKNYEN